MMEKKIDNTCVRIAMERSSLLTCAYLISLEFAKFCSMNEGLMFENDRLKLEETTTLYTLKLLIKFGSVNLKSEQYNHVVVWKFPWKRL